jgi:hypothetical protein
MKLCFDISDAGASACSGFISDSLLHSAFESGELLCVLKKNPEVDEAF